MAVSLEDLAIANEFWNEHRHLSHNHYEEFSCSSLTMRSANHSGSLCINQSEKKTLSIDKSWTSQKMPGDAAIDDSLGIINYSKEIGGKDSKRNSKKIHGSSTITRELFSAG